MKLLSSHPTLPFSSDFLPLSLIHLKDWKLVSVYGKDSLGYLQRQFTFDITELKMNSLNFSSHCNSNGKIISFFYLFYYKNGIAYVQRKSVCSRQIKELKKYSVFSKIKIFEENKLELFGVAGPNAEKILRELFEIIPEEDRTILQKNDDLLIYFASPIPRFILIVNLKKSEKIKSFFLSRKAVFMDSNQWMTLDIESGYPILDIENSEKFLPQSMNVHLLNGVSFKKGCYMGQEIISKVQYRKINKFSLCWLSGKSNDFPKIGEIIESKSVEQDQWFRSGKILSSCKLNNGEIWIQAIINRKTLGTKNIFRIYQSRGNIFSIRSMFNNIK